MAEFLGVASSIAGLVALADMVVYKGYRCYKFLKDVKEAETTVKKIVDEVNTLAGVLHSLANMVGLLEEDNTDVDHSLKTHSVEDCYKTLNTVSEHLTKAFPDAAMTKREKIKWTLKKSETKELLSEIQRHKSTMSLAMNANDMSVIYFSCSH